MKLYFALQSLLDSLRTEDKGATAVEYGLIVSLIAIAIIGAVTAVGVALTALFNNVAGNL